MFVFLYVIIVLCVVGFFVWSALVVHDQKRSWAQFAAKRGLTFTRGKFMDAARVDGTIDGIGVTLFSDVQRLPDARGERHVSVLEFQLGRGMPTGAALGTPEMQPFISGLSFTENCPVTNPKWKTGYIVRCRDAGALSAYLTEARIESLAQVFGMNRVAALFFFDEQDAILHIETADPLRDPVKLDRIVTRLLNDGRKLRIDHAGDEPLPVVVEPTMTAQVPAGGEETATLPPAETPTL